MRKKLLIIFMLLSASLCACQKETGEGAEADEEAGEEAEESCFVYQIADFDTRDDYYNFWLDSGNTGTIGRTTINREAEYISQGNGSMKWEMEGACGSMWNGESYDSGALMNANYKITNNTKKLMTDLGNVRYLSLDCYNDNAFEIIFTACLLCRENGADFCLSNDSVTIAPGEWGTIQMSLDRYSSDMYNYVVEIPVTVNYAHRVAGEKTELVEAGELYFPEATVYLDNFYAVVGNAGTEEKKEFADPDEILSFDSITDMQYASTYMGTGELSWNEMNQKYGTGVSAQYNVNPAYTNGREGSLMMRVDNVICPSDGTKRQYTVNSSYDQTQVGVEFKGVLEQINFLRLQEGDRIALDIYNGFDHDKDVYFGCDDVVNGRNVMVPEEYPYTLGHTVPLSTRYKLPKGTWTTIYFDKSEELDLSQGLVRIRLATSRLDVFEPGCFYMNHLRLVKEGEE